VTRLAACPVTMKNHHHIFPPMKAEQRKRQTLMTTFAIPQATSVVPVSLVI